MDSNSHRPDEPAVPLHTRFAIISTHSSDKLRLLKFTEAENDAITGIVKRSWHNPIQYARSPIQYERSHCSAYEIKLVGRPFHCSDRSSSDATPSRVLIRDLLAFLFSQGWVFTSPTAITAKRRDGDTLIFRKQPMPLPEMEWLAIMFGGGDHLRLIGAPSQLIKGIQAFLQSYRLIQSEKLENRAYNSYDFKIHGWLWRPRVSAESVAARELILGLLETLEKFGWSLYASVEHNSGEPNEDDYKVDSWYCVKRRDWVPGRPVFHR